MKRIVYIFLIGCIFILGIMIGKPSKESIADDIQGQIDDFEKGIESPEGVYESDKRNRIEPNMSNSLAKTGENVLEKIFDFAFGIIDDFVN